MKLSIVAPIATTLLLVCASASAQTRGEAAAERTAEGASLAEFIEGASAAAAEAGGEAPDRATLEAAFREGDTNGDGVLDAREQNTGNRAPARCNNRGVCHMGRCFCVSGRLLEEEEAGTAAQENPVFLEGPGPSTNVIGD